MVMKRDSSPTRRVRTLVDRKGQPSRDSTALQIRKRGDRKPRNSLVINNQEQLSGRKILAERRREAIKTARMTRVIVFCFSLCAPW